MCYIIIDGHCDTLSRLLDERINFNDNMVNHVSLDGLKEGRVILQFFAAWVGSKKLNSSYLQRGLKLIDIYYRMIDENIDNLYPIKNLKDLDYVLNSNKIGTLLTIEGGEVLEGKIANLRILYKLGVRAITLTWNNRNEIADSIMDTSSIGGITEFGVEVIHEMMALKMMIDVSHLSIKGFWDVVEICKSPVVATHSNAKAICSHPRNLDNDQIKAIANTEGLVGVNFYPLFLAEGNSNIKDIIKHIEHIAGFAGIDYVGFGSDFDGIDLLPDGISGSRDFLKVIDELLKINYKESDIMKICSKNYIRVLKDILN